MNLQSFYAILPILSFFMGVVCVFMAFSSSLNKSVADRKKSWSNYLEEDLQSNFIRKKEIPSDILLTVELDKIPSRDDLECKLKWESLMKFEDALMCNLTQFSNLELKQQFGYQGFQLLLGYEQTYMAFMDELVEYGLFLNNKGYIQEAIATLEYASVKHCDKSICYLTLIEIYGIIKDRLKLEALENIISRNLVHSVYYKEVLEKLQNELIQISK